MRAFLITTLLLATAGCAGGGERPHFRQGPPGGPGGPGGPRGEWGGAPRGRLFVSPMGEPFRGEPGADAPQVRWFAGVDTNHDGVLTQAEFDADAARFFAILDRGHDGEIDPGDVDYYEQTMLPEIRTGGPGGMGGGEGRMRGGGGMGRRGGGEGGPPGGGGPGGGGMGGGGGRHRGGFGGGEGGAPSGGGNMRSPMGKQGAGRFGYLDFPEPVTAADRNFNRGVDANEFERAADERFALLDTNHDGKITADELPRLAAGPGGFGGRRPLPEGRPPEGTPPENPPEE